MLYIENDSINTFICFIDYESEWTTFGKIVEQFIECIDDKKAKLVVYYHYEQEKERQLAESLSEALDKTAINSSIDIHGISYNDDEKMISKAEYFIVGRDIRNILRISYAFKYDVKIISAVNDPICWN